jgi:hypothetical protein
MLSAAKDLAAFPTCHGVTTESLKCHAERSEGFLSMGYEMFGYAQHDNAYCNINLN